MKNNRLSFIEKPVRKRKFRNYLTKDEWIERKTTRKSLFLLKIIDYNSNGNSFEWKVTVLGRVQFPRMDRKKNNPEEFVSVKNNLL